MRYWTEHEIALAADHSLTARQVGELLGRTRAAVKRKRNELNTGRHKFHDPHGTSPDAWTPEEDELLRQLVHLPAPQIAVRIGRSTRAVWKRRAKLGIYDGGVGIRWANDPTCIAQRRLLARTCTGCGELLSAKFFGQVVYQGRSQWRAQCHRCRNEAGGGNGRYNPKGEDKNARDRAIDHHLQALSLPYAKRHGEVYTDADDATLANPRLTVLEKAVRVERTYYAAQQRCKNHGWTSRNGYDRDAGRWVILPPEEVVAAS